MKKLFYLITLVLGIAVYAKAEVILSEPDGYVNGKPYQDLGLNSGIVWAMQNVGAESAEEYGDYFAWGEVEPKDEYTVENYKYFESWHSDVKGNEKAYWTSSLNMEDISGTEYDAARHNWGAPWRMPTIKEIAEMALGVTIKYTVINGVEGMLLTSHMYNMKSHNIFVPASGYAKDKKKVQQEEICEFWSSTQSNARKHGQGIPLGIYENADIYYSDITTGSQLVLKNDSICKAMGLTIRPVISREDLAKVMAVQGDADNIRIIYKDGNLKIANSTKEFAVSVVDLSGRTLYSRQVQGGEEIPMALSKGIYLITARNNTIGVKTAKVYVK